MGKDTKVKVSNWYGRARRIEFVEKVAYILAGIVAVVLVFLIVFRQQEEVDDNVNFAYMRTYLENKGFHCEMLHRAGGQCTLTNENNSYSFIRYDDGFEYIANTKGYVLNIKHKLSEDDSIIFRTTSSAFLGYKNQKYTCKFKKNVLNELDGCYDEAGYRLDSESYNDVIVDGMLEVNRIIDSSGYSKHELLENYQWIKK